MKTYEKIKSELEERSIPFGLILFADKVKHARGFDNSITGNYEPKESVKTVIVSAKKKLKAILLNGHDLIDGKKLREFVGNKWRMANEDELKSIGFIPGTVCPLALPEYIEIFVDQKILNQKKWNTGSGDLGKGLLFNSKIAINNLNNPKIVNISKPKLLINNSTMNFTKQKVLDLIKTIKVAKVLEIREHPNADRLVLVDVDFGEGPKQVVTGAKNMNQGDFVPFLGEGNIVPGYLFFEGEEIVLKKKDLRGVESDSMILAEDEIGLGKDHEGIYLIKTDDTSIGKELSEVLSEDKISLILKNAGVIEITDELHERIGLIKSIAKYGGEIVGEDELPEILTRDEQLITYDGFEPSGQMHIAQGVIRAINTNKMIKAGFTFKMWVADWFGYLNNKMGGDMEKIKTVGDYFIEIWRATGMDLDHTEFLWTSDYTGDSEYWETVMKIAKQTSLNRITKNVEIMGRSGEDNLTGAHIFYPCMQAADIFYVMKSQVTQLGMDQRKVNIMAREVGEQLGYWKPVIVSHGMLQGLQKPVGEKISVIEELSENKVIELGKIYKTVVRVDFFGDSSLNVTVEDPQNGKKNSVRLAINSSATISGTTIRFDKPGKVTIEKTDVDPVERSISMKMSKSKPDTAIFMTDSKKDIERKIRKAYCPEGIVEDNPILDYCRQIIFEAHHLKGHEDILKDGFVVSRPEKFGGDVVYKSYEELENAYIDKSLFPLDLKNAVVNYLDILVKPVRDHFESDTKAKNLLNMVESFKVTR